VTSDEQEEPPNFIAFLFSRHLSLVTSKRASAFKPNRFRFKPNRFAHKPNRFGNKPNRFSAHIPEILLSF
jgi:hypothetical protein